MNAKQNMISLSQHKNLRCAVFGAGSVGTLVGAYLTKNGLNIDLFDRNLKHIEALATNGATVEGYDNFNVPVSAFSSQLISEQYDIIFLSTKPSNNPDTVSFLAPFLKEDSVLVSLQDGYPEDFIPRIVGSHKCIFSSLIIGVEVVYPGVVKLSSPRKANFIYICGLNEVNSDKFAIVKEMLETVCKVFIFSNLEKLRWMRLVFYSSSSALSALTGFSYGQLFSHKDCRLLVISIARETGNISRACGFHVSPLIAISYVLYMNMENKFTFVLAYYLLPLFYKDFRLLRTNMLRQIMNKEKSEIDEFNGRICCFGERLKISTPLNRDVVRRIHEIEDGKRTVSPDNLDAFSSLPQLREQFQKARRQVFISLFVVLVFVVFVLIFLK